MQQSTTTVKRLKKLMRIALDFFRKVGYEISIHKIDADFYRCVSLKTAEPVKGNVLLAYILEPFKLTNAVKLNSHTHYWESFQIAQTFLSLGYHVDVIDYRNSAFVPKKTYDFFISARVNFQTIAERLNKECVKVVHLDTSHWVVNNYYAYKRYIAFQQRRKATPKLRKTIEQTWAIENADCATILGNQYTIDTYAFAGKPIYRIPISTCATYPSPIEKDFKACRTNFMWMGSKGLIHKGLDLALDAFVEMPEYQLFVIGPISREKDFENTYYDELYNTPNINTLGWVDVTSDQFLDISNNCLAIVYPSCAEGQCGSVINCMHAGLIPIVSYESGVDIGDFGIVLYESSTNEIKDAVRRVAGMPESKIKQMSMDTWKYVNKNHSRESYAQAYLDFAKTLLNCNRNR